MLDEAVPSMKASLVWQNTIFISTARSFPKLPTSADAYSHTYKNYNQYSNCTGTVSKTIPYIHMPTHTYTCVCTHTGTITLSPSTGLCRRGQPTDSAQSCFSAPLNPFFSPSLLFPLISLLSLALYLSPSPPFSLILTLSPADFFSSGPGRHSASHLAATRVLFWSPFPLHSQKPTHFPNCSQESLTWNYTCCYWKRALFCLVFSACLFVCLVILTCGVRLAVQIMGDIGDLLKLG